MCPASGAAGPTMVRSGLTCQRRSPSQAIVVGALRPGRDEKSRRYRSGPLTRSRVSMRSTFSSLVIASRRLAKPPRPAARALSGTQAGGDDLTALRLRNSPNSTAAVPVCSAAGERRRLRAGIPGQAGVPRDRAGPDRFELGQPGLLTALAALCETPGRGHRGHHARIHAAGRLSQRPGAAAGQLRADAADAAPPPARSACPRSRSGSGCWRHGAPGSSGTGITLMGDTVARGLRAARQPSPGVSERRIPCPLAPL